MGGKFDSLFSGGAASPQRRIFRRIAGVLAFIVLASSLQAATAAKVKSSKVRATPTPKPTATPTPTPTPTPVSSPTPTPTPAPGATITGSVFVAKEPYDIIVGNQVQHISLSGKSFTFDFGGSVPFVNPSIGIADFDTINYWDSAAGKAKVINGWTITDAGIPGRVFKTNGYTAIGYKAGDGVVEGALRTQLNSYYVPSRRRFVWDLCVRFGGADLTKPWTFMPRDSHPGLIWQIKPDGSPPSIGMVVDTDPTNSQRLAIHIDGSIGPELKHDRLGMITGLLPQQDINIVIDAYLDDRPIASGGQGYFKAWINGTLVANAVGATLVPNASSPHYWSMAMYLYNDTTPLQFDYFGYWKRARMIVPN
ncbi:hypothetical protein [Methylococcus capsulatus]|uniref:hypothetical protein n=1 Tax=Methylococcus capsulatus TaxID=414 RepID=UPI001C531888|nr:hypothetical protein [Methylococcus capsulatus]QXP89429.1 hypothetical protein KW114_09910 [Methylococcus capsulatus]